MEKRKSIGMFAKSVKSIFTPTNHSTPTERIPSTRGYRADLNCIHDSKMEANIHRFYLYLIKKWQNSGNGIIKVEYEPDIFKFTDNRYNIRYYIPDFKVFTATDFWYVEVKGFVDDSAIKKDKLMASQYPRVKINYILPKHYKLIYKYYAKYIPNWE